MEHELKAWTDPFDGVWDGFKGHEVRKNDRPYNVGDVLLLREWNPPDALGERGFTGREVRVLVTYLSAGGTWGLPADLCVMSITVLCRRAHLGGRWQVG